jgi:SAM-dependent methyltransferase
MPSPKYYSHFADRKRNKWGSLLVKKVFEKLAKIAAEGSPVKILEIGIGKGIFFEALKKEIPQMEYTGIEASEALFAEAKSKGINAIKCLVPPFPKELENGSFDLVVMSHVIEHFLDWREVLEVLNAINALLKNGGKLLLFYPCARDFGMDFFETDYSHSYVTTSGRVDCLLADTGFRVIKRDSYRACFNNFRFFFFCISKIINRFAFLNVKTRDTFNKNLLTVAEKIYYIP